MIPEEAGVVLEAADVVLQETDGSLRRGGRGALHSLLPTSVIYKTLAPVRARKTYA